MAPLDHKAGVTDPGPGSRFRQPTVACRVAGVKLLVRAAPALGCRPVSPLLTGVEIMKAVLAAITISLVTALPAAADTLLLDDIEAREQAVQGSDRGPSRGASMATVYAQYGEPRETRDAVGEPPISRWVYPAYTVYFEHDIVLDVVIHR
jgi:hypothetical protein